MAKYIELANELDIKKEDRLAFAKQKKAEDDTRKKKEEKARKEEEKARNKVEKARNEEEKTKKEVDDKEMAKGLEDRN
jgi:hypothetical protein